MLTRPVSTPAWQLERSLLGLAAIALGLAFPPSASAVPSYARQMKVACNGCHVQFPVLNEFGREFKLMGYTQIERPTIQEKAPSGRTLLDLPLPDLLSVMFQADYTHTGSAEPGAKNNDIQFPDQLSLFVAGRLAPKMGSFVQVTYSGADDHVGLDNADIRLADRREVHGTDVIYGLSMNNNPSVTDPWNSTPAWGYPYASPPSAPMPTASPLVDGGLAQQVAGVDAYALVHGTVYAEAGIYGAAPLGASRPLTPDGNLTGPAAYWRLALQKDWGENHLMIGHYGLHAAIDPGGGATDSRFTDAALDFQYQRRLGHDTLQVQGSWIHEWSRFDAAAGSAANSTNHLDRLSVDATYYLGQMFSFTASPFWLWGSSDPVLYAPGSVTGSANGNPESGGLVAQVSYNPWLNTRLSLQYTAWFDFNGRKNDYDGQGRSASDNNALLVQFWGVW
jgi:hypothetical protein